MDKLPPYFEKLEGVCRSSLPGSIYQTLFVFTVFLRFSVYIRRDDIGPIAARRLHSSCTHLTYPDSDSPFVLKSNWPGGESDRT